MTNPVTPKNNEVDLRSAQESSVKPPQVVGDLSVKPPQGNAISVKPPQEDSDISVKPPQGQ
jgi:hypothetical protein